MLIAAAAALEGGSSNLRSARGKVRHSSSGRSLDSASLQALRPGCRSRRGQAEGRKTSHLSASRSPVDTRQGQCTTQFGLDVAFPA